MKRQIVKSKLLCGIEMSKGEFMCSLCSTSTFVCHQFKQQFSWDANFPVCLVPTSRVVLFIKQVRNRRGFAHAGLLLWDCQHWFGGVAVVLQQVPQHYRCV